MKELMDNLISLVLGCLGLNRAGVQVSWSLPPPVILPRPHHRIEGAALA